MAYIDYPMTLKKLVKEISGITGKDEQERTFWQIDRSFQADKISWEEHEMLYDLASRIMF